ncbi:hypothetical protein D9756_001104 [Leucocoprinus leucothites]|uniref:Inositol polyphosphate-related phosphatase domain-containing protein n=1 Tax=Leucocoprinus leucothites TaxID=201217 RepID=A0A8H5LNL5_9AGAR|nr:hypothetical protein D9756_001104 [Leucoagaricus leucothites]
MNSQDIDGESLQAVKSLRSKFEQLAVDTSSQVRRPSSNPNSTNGSAQLLGPASARPRQSSGSQVDVFSPQAHIRTSSSSSDLKVSAKRPPPPPPPRIAKSPASPRPSRSPSPSSSPQVNIVNEKSEEEVLQGVAALKSKFDSPSRNGVSHGAGTGSLPMESPKPILPPRPSRNGEYNLLSPSPNSTEPSSPTSSRPVSPLQHHRPPPPPPVSRSKSPLLSVEQDNGVASTKSRLTSPTPPSSLITRQNTSKSSTKPAIPPRPPKQADSPQPTFSNGSLIRSPDSASPNPDKENFIPSPIPPSIPLRRSPPDATPAVATLIDVIQASPEPDYGQLAPPIKPSRATMPPPPRHRSTVSPNSPIGDSGTPSPKLPHHSQTQPPPLPTRRGTGTVAHVEELPAVTSPRLPDRTTATTSPPERRPIGANKLPPPPTRTIALGDKLPPPRRPPSPESEDDSGEEDDPKANAADSMPDTTSSSRRPPVLSFRGEGRAEPKIHVHPHSGTFVVSGSNVVVGHGEKIKIYDLSLADSPILTLDTKDLGVRDAKVTCMEFRPTAVKVDRGALLWIGLKEGHLFEIDIRTGYVIATKHVAHPHPVTNIFRYGRSMVTLDEGGKTLIFSPDENGEDISLQYTQPRVVRTTEKQEFVKLLDGKLWTATRTEQHSHGHQRCPIIRVYDIFNPAAATGRSLLPTEHVGSVTSATIIPSQQDFVYVGHEEGYISIWSLRTDDGYPKCVEVVRVATSDVLCVEGVNDRLWAGARSGMISAYDVSQKPWVVTNSWDAHPKLPVLKLSVNYNAVEKNGKLCVVSVGRDETLRLWDGLLSANWIDNELYKSEQDSSSFHNLSMLLVSWNCDSARPDSLTSDPVNYEFLKEALTSVDSPDIITFGFQEVIDLESRKMTAKNVLLGGKKKAEDNGLSDRVTGAYKRWHDRLTAAVRATMSPGCPYVCVHTENLVGLFTCIFVKASQRASLDDVAVTTIKRGMGGRYGNKGAIVARFVIGDSSVCIINCHLAAGQNAIRRRNADAAGILEEKTVFPAGDHSLAYVGGGDGTMVLDHELVFFHGDLNYRIDHRRDAIIAAVRANDLSSLYQHDQLLREVKYNRGCRLRGFSEGPLTFPPTYKYDRRSNEYDTSEKHRAPAWCDRILWRSREVSRVAQTEYRRYEVNVSDHRPISASFDLTVKTIDKAEREKRKREVEQAWVDVEGRLLKSARQFYLLSNSILGSRFLIASLVGVYTFGPIWGRIVDTRGPRIPLTGAFVLLLTGYSGIKYAFDAGVPQGAMTISTFTFALVVLCNFMTGAGGNGGLTSSVNSTARSFPDRARATATGLVISGFGLSAFIFSTIAHIMYAGNTSAFLQLLALGTSAPMLVGFFLVRHIPLPPSEEPTIGGSVEAVTSTSALMDDSRVRLLDREDSDVELDESEALSREHLHGDPRSRSLSISSSASVLARSPHGQVDDSVPNIFGAELWKSGDFWLLFILLSLRESPFSLLGTVPVTIIVLCASWTHLVAGTGLMCEHSLLKEHITH